MSLNTKDSDRTAPSIEHSSGVTEPETYKAVVEILIYFVSQFCCQAGWYVCSNEKQLPQSHYGKEVNSSPFTVFKYTESSNTDDDFGFHPEENRFRANEVG